MTLIKKTKQKVSPKPQTGSRPLEGLDTFFYPSPQPSTPVAGLFMAALNLNPTSPTTASVHPRAAGPIYHFNSNNNTISDSWTGDYFLNSSLCELAVVWKPGGRTENPQ